MEIQEVNKFMFQPSSTAAVEIPTRPQVVNNLPELRDAAEATDILDKMRQQRKNNKYCDVIFHVQDQKFGAHKNVLAACSPYFDSVLRVNKSPDHLTVNCKNLQVFETFIDFLYMENIKITEESLPDLLHLSNHYLIHKLKDHCGNFMGRNISTRNCFGIKEKAEKCGLDKLAKDAETFITQHLSEALNEDEILGFNITQFQGLMVDYKQPLDDFTKLLLITRWVKANPEERKRNFLDLLSLVQWENINLSAVYEFIKSEALFNDNETCLCHILEVLEAKGLLLNLYYDTLRHLQYKLALEKETEKAKEIVQQVTEANLMDSVETSDLVDDYTDQGGIENISDETKFQNLVPSENTAENVATLDVQVDKMRTQGNESVSEHTAGNDEENRPNESVSEHTAGNDEENRPKKRKRKGIPTKVLSFPKARLKSETVLSIKIPKRGRGRPSRKTYSSDKRDNSKTIPKPKENKKKTGRKKKSKVIEKNASDEEEEESHNLIVDELMEDDVLDPTFTMENEGLDLDDEEDLEDEDDSFFGQAKKIKRDVQNNGLKNKDIPRKKGRPKKDKMEKNVGCDKCQFFTNSETKLMKHMEKAHRDDKTYSCTVCEFETKWNKEFYGHMKTHFKGPPYKCDFALCDHTVDRIQALLHHRMVHTDERPYQCSICNMKFRSRNNLTTHFRCHTGEKPFQCDVCQRRFATKNTMLQHSVTHGNDRPYLCDTCGFSTKYQSHLIAHKRIHSGEVFRCQFPNCGYFTPKKSQLGAHMRIHLHIRSHVCSVCGRAFVEKSHLVRHERIHLDAKPFKCDLCDYGSSRRDKLKEHVLKHHGDNASVKVPYKPRKARKQTYDPEHFPYGLNGGNETTENVNATTIQVQVPSNETSVTVAQPLNILSVPATATAPTSQPLTLLSVPAAANVTTSQGKTDQQNTTILTSAIDGLTSASTIDGRSIGIMNDGRLQPNLMTTNLHQIADGRVIQMVAPGVQAPTPIHPHQVATGNYIQQQNPAPNQPQTQAGQTTQQQASTDLSGLTAFIGIFG